jgi:hypothetical protein
VFQIQFIDLSQCRNAEFLCVIAQGEIRNRLRIIIFNLTGFAEFYVEPLCEKL